MNCLFLALEGFTAAALASARNGGRLPALEPLANSGLLADLTFPLADARAAMLVSAMTGTWPDQHGILVAETADAVGSPLQPVPATDRAQAALCEPLDMHGIECVSVGWPVAITGQTERSAIVSEESVHPESLASILSDCRLRADELDAEAIEPLAPRWRQVNQAVDNRLAALAGALADNVSRHAAFLTLLDERHWQFATLCLSLPGELDSLERASEPFADELFTGLGVRAMPLLDAFLAEIVRRVPAETNVIIAGLPHSEMPDVPGFVLMHGDAFEMGATLRAITALDLAPLVWRVCGFQSAGMPGTALLPAVRTSHPQRALEIAWTPPANHRPRDHARLLKVPAPILKKEGEPVQAGELWHYNSLSVLGRSLIARAEWLPALPVLEALTRLAPNDRTARCQLSNCQKLLGLHSAALDSAYAAVHPQFRDDPTPLLLAAELEVITGNPGSARKLLDQAKPYLAGAPNTGLLHAKALIALREWSHAADILKSAVRATPREAHAHLLLARCHLAHRHWQEAFDSAVQAANLDASNPLTHEIMGHALLEMGMYEQARQAFEAAIASRPRWPRPWARLALLARRAGKPETEVTRFIGHYRRLKREAGERRQARLESAALALLDTASSPFTAPISRVCGRG